MQADIADSERLAVFVFHSNEMKEDAVHWRAFLPGKDGERSLFRVDGLDYYEIAAIGQECAAARPNEKLQGWAIISAADVRKLQGLQLKADNTPPRHGFIDTWPDDKNDRRILAMSLADVAATTRFPCAP